MKTIDLHVHSAFSDGTFSPEEIIDLAIKKGLSAFALTDHDTVSGIDAALQYAQQINAPLQVIPGIEISAEHHKKEIHIVGLYINHHDTHFIREIEVFAERRLHRNEEMAARFQKAGIPMTIEDLQEGNPDTIITRAHFARYLISHHVVKDAKEAFSDYLGEDSPFYVPRARIAATEAICLILQNGGIPVLAHPIHYHMTESDLRKMIAEFKENGLVGIEVKYSNHTTQDEVFVRRLSQEFQLLPSGGSDFHGGNKPDIDLGTGRGNLTIPYEYLEQFRSWHDKHNTF
ncbi:MAG: PHP domain-containing protein [Butyribacter sp.]|nr:PHP domain-containing protein [bacterium]MDY3853633.1 PHP domain-containing protein [Butyribacter sp.]